MPLCTQAASYSFSTLLLGDRGGKENTLCGKPVITSGYEDHYPLVLVSSSLTQDLARHTHSYTSKAEGRWVCLFPVQLLMPAAAACQVSEGGGFRESLSARLLRLQGQRSSETPNTSHP